MYDKLLRSGFCMYVSEENEQNCVVTDISRTQNKQWQKKKENNNKSVSHDEKWEIRSGCCMRGD